MFQFISKSSSDEKLVSYFSDTAEYHEKFVGFERDSNSHRGVSRPPSHRGLVASLN
jgi:hypothetical protein